MHSTGLPLSQVLGLIWIRNRYVRVYLLPDQRDSRQTLMQRKTQSPVFNESFSYSLDYREVSRRHLMLKVHDVDRSAASPASCHQLIGQVVFPLADVNLLKGVHVWKRIKPPDQVKHSFLSVYLFLHYSFHYFIINYWVGNQVLSYLAINLGHGIRQDLISNLIIIPLIRLVNLQ